MKIKELNLDKWEFFSNRHNSLVYNSPDGRWMVKLYNPGFGGESIEELAEEQRISQAVHALGVSTPLAGDLVQSEDKIGLIFERIPNKTSFARQIKNHPEEVETAGRNFAKTVKQLHSTECNTEIFKSRHEHLKEIIRKCRIVNEDERKRALEFLAAIPEKTTCIHGDLHTGNAIFNETGTYIIDLGSFSYGNPDLDIGTFYLFTNLLPEPVSQAAIYCDHSLGRKLWTAFASEYFGVKKEDVPSLDGKYSKLAGIHLFEFDSRIPAPFIREVMDKCLFPFICQHG